MGSLIRLHHGEPQAHRRRINTRDKTKTHTPVRPAITRLCEDSRLFSSVGRACASLAYGRGLDPRRGLLLPIFATICANATKRASRKNYEFCINTSAAQRADANARSGRCQVALWPNG